MLQGAVKARRDNFIKEMIAYGSQSVENMIKAYKASYPSCKSDVTARTSGYRLIQDPYVMNAITVGLQEKEEAIKRARQKEIERLAKEQVATEIELDAQLSQIALGRHVRKKKVAAFNKEGQLLVGTVDEVPSGTEMIAATNLLFKRKGSFAPIGVKHEAGDSFVEALKLISQKRKNDVPEGSH